VYIVGLSSCLRVFVLTSAGVGVRPTSVIHNMKPRCRQQLAVMPCIDGLSSGRSWLTYSAQTVTKTLARKVCLTGDRSFVINGGPAVWNSLSVALRSPDTSLDILKDKLKTSSSELSIKCAFAALANLRSINHLIIIIIII